MKLFAYKVALWALFALSCIPISVHGAQPDSLFQEKEAPSVSRYERRVARGRHIWSALIPRQGIVQTAGNMGLVSVGVGWNYGHRDKWETDLLLGFIPKYDSSRPKTTLTLKENFLPWRLAVGDRGWNVEPLACGLYVNTVFGHEFWQKQPSRYPKGYYKMLSTRFRANIFFGQRVTYEIPARHRSFVRSLTAFYEVSTCDLYLRLMFQGGSVHLSDVLGLSLGLKLQFF
ncbi:MAG: hypothetical protein IJ722_04980 [Alloprevotella sp.]|nr:hypothetical protein [Alloprevotella sp.]